MHLDEPYLRQFWEIEARIATMEDRLQVISDRMERLKARGIDVELAEETCTTMLQGIHRLRFQLAGRERTAVTEYIAPRRR